MAARVQGCHPMAGTRARLCSSILRPFSAALCFSSISKNPSEMPMSPFPQKVTSRKSSRVIFVAAADSDAPIGLQGLAETAALDELIDILLSATDANDLTQKVAENMLSFDQRFWLRLATRTDSAAEPEEKEKLASLAKVVMQLVDAMVRKTNAQLTDSAGVLQEILKAAADERTGEWKLPLPADKVAAMRAAMDARAEFIDEALLSNCFAWMRKASDDNLDGMVVILQKVLQIYASRALSLDDVASDSGKTSSPAEAVLSELLNADEGTWAPIIRKKAQGGEISEVSFLEALQRKMESVVLGLSSGSYSQRVQAEYLKELESRSKEVFADLAAGR
ncbi:hypothetical protein Ndes2526B_g06947 [Nannochloris sp. 'desiccata']